MDGGAASDDQPPSPTPKLSLFSFPNLQQKKPEEPPGMLTPPVMTTLASVPFQWEEAPGKPRTSSSTSSSSPSSDSRTTARRRLELPPRLLLAGEGSFTDLPSPTTVLNGPDSGRSLTHTLSFSSLVGRRSSSFRKERRDCSNSRRFGSFGGAKEGDKERGSSDFSFDRGCDDDRNVKKFTRVRKRHSFFGSSKSHFLTSMYESVKHALLVVPWRSRKHQEK